MGISARTKHILLTTLVFVLLSALIIGLTVGLRTPPKPNGGSSPDTRTAARRARATLMSSTGSDKGQKGSTRWRHLATPDKIRKLDLANFIEKMHLPGIVNKPQNGLNKPRRKIYNKENAASKPQTTNCVDELQKTESLNSPSTDTNKSVSVSNPPWPASVTRTFNTAAVSTDTVPCSTIGRDVLAAGGSAVDAAVAAAVCVGVVNHQSSGIGGGHFMTIYERPRGCKSMEVNTIVARETAPLAATEDMFVNKTEASRKGGLSVAVPGEVSGMYTAWQRYGRLPWSDLFQPSIRLCEDGFVVETALSDAIKQYEDVIRNDPNLSELFVKDDGTLVTEGDILRNPKLGRTLSRIAADPDTFYSGRLAEDIIDDLTEYGSILTLEDLSNYKAKLKPALNIQLSNGDFTAYTVRPPSSGVIYQYILNILNGYRFYPDMLSHTESKVLAYHRIIEANKFAYAKRSLLGDEDFVDMQQVLINLTSADYGEYIRSRINDNTTFNYTYYDPEFDSPIDSGTSTLAVIAPDGAAVAMTMTINIKFGSNIRGSRTGIMFNDEMDDFSTPGTTNYYGVPASPANYIQPGKMPLSSMCPALIFDNDGEVHLATGAAGGTRITTATAFVSMQTLWFKKDLQNATDTARIHHQLIPEDVKYEPHLEQNVILGLKEKNHDMTEYGPIAVVFSVQKACSSLKQNFCIHATSDGRKGGQPDGI